ncbi:hypothetical protein GGR50DRAFT_311440 [Xylaria sp. CBS 124048]|nr:hypothetical protein GGR50DRAFT_311440 [Xylaria sp. CBS 124048]
MPILGLEIPAFGGLAAIQAAKLGATRIELNAAHSYSAGGLTPSLSDLRTFLSSYASTSTSISTAASPTTVVSGTKTSRDIPVRIMIRPRGPPPLPPGASAASAAPRDFIYTEAELDEMEGRIRDFAASGLLDVERGDGFVFGVLEEEEEEEGRHGVRINERQNQRLARASKPFRCIFHRAFDEVISSHASPSSSSSSPSSSSSWEPGLEILSRCGFDGILTAGGRGRAIDNIATLNDVLSKAKEFDIEIIIGGGVRTGNVGEIVGRVQSREGGGEGKRRGRVYVHSACLAAGGKREEEEEGDVVDPGEVRGIMAQLR